MAGSLGLGIRGRVGRAAAWTACVLGALAADRATAQSYRVDKPKLTQVEMQQALSKVAGILRQTTDPPAADLKTLDDYFAGYYFPMITSADPAQLGKLGELRKALFARFINSAKSQGGRDYLVNLALKNAQAQSIGNYHPAVRYNAVLILGQLDQAGAAGQPPKPIPAATKSLIVLMQRDEVNSVPITQAVKMAALVGLERHARLGADPASAQQITDAALAVANRKDPPEEISADINNWMRALAAQVLISQHAAGVTAPVNDVLVNLIGSAELGLDDRCRVAELLVPGMYSGAQGVDPEGMALAIGKLAKAVLAEERKKAQKYQDEMVGDASFTPGGGRGGFDGGGRGGYGGGGRGGYGGGGGRGGFGGGMMGEFTEDTGPKYERRRLVDRLAAVQIASAAVVGGGSDDLKQRVAELANLLKGAVTTAANEDTTELALADLVVELAGDVNAIVNGWTPDDAPTAGEDAGDDEFAGAN